MNIKAKKHFGQNFLKDEAVKSKIIQSIPTFVCDRIVEIGPGLGDLTQRLVKTGKKLDLFEIDSELIGHLKNRFKEQFSSAQMRLFNTDAAQNWEQISSEGEYFLVSNLPYYVATKLILSAIDDINCVGAVVMTQKEVALKFAAQNGEKEFCALSVLAQIYGGCELLFDVEKTAFEPVPKVTSSVIKFERKIDFTPSPSPFKQFLKIAFSAPRKQLLNSLIKSYDKELIKAIFADLKIASNARAHELCVALYLNIFQRISSARGLNP